MKIPRQMCEAMVEHARYVYPEEACGLLAADADGRLRMVYCLTNEEHSESAYTIEPVEHFGALQHAERQGWELAGAFHSHPHSSPYPSATDLRLAAEPDWLYVIVGLADPERPLVRGFRLVGGNVEEIRLITTDGDRPNEGARA